MKYIFFDIDGTLLSHEEGISPSTIEALNLLKEKGHKIFICTGRSYAEVPETIYKFNFDGVIAAAGGYVKYQDEIIYNKILPDHMVDNLVYFLNKFDIPFVLEGETMVYTRKDAIYAGHENLERLREKKEKTKYEFSAIDFIIPRKHSIEEYFENRTNINKLTVYADSYEQLVELERVIDKDYYIIKYETAGELLVKGINKFTGIEKMLKHLDVSVEDTIAIGDSLNDYDMVESCKIGIAMGNSSQPLKDIADYITTDVDDDGIYNAMKHFELI